MAHEDRILEKIRLFVLSEKYRVKIHALRHMIEEGFNEEDIIEAIGNGRILENHGGLAQRKEERYNEKAKGINGTTMHRVWWHSWKKINFSGI